jgi:hypothetical protein
MARVFDLIDSSAVLSTISLINTSGIVAPVGGYGEASLSAPHLTGDDPTTSGKVLETYKLMLRASSQDNAASQYQALLSMLRKAARYAIDPRQTAPVYLKQQMLNETSPRYALCYGAYELVNPNLFRTIFDSKAWIEEFGLTLIREHPWRSGIPGTLPTILTLTATDGAASPTAVHLSGLRDNNAITHIYTHDNSAGAGGFSANLAGTATFGLFPASTAVDDCLYIGSTTGPLHNIVIPVATPGVYTATMALEIYTGAAFVALTVGTEYTIYPTDTLTSLFKVAGDWAFNVFGKSGWAVTTVNGVSAWWLKLHITAFTSMGTIPATGTPIPYNAKSNFLEIPASGLAGDMPATIDLRLAAPSGATTTPGPGNTSRIILGAKSRNLAANEFTAQLDNSTLTGWAYTYGTDSATAASYLGPSLAYTNITFATDSTLVARLIMTGTSKLAKWAGKYRVFILANQAAGAAGETSIRLRTWIGATTAGNPKFDTPTVALKAVSPATWEVVDMGTLRLPFSEEMSADGLTADLIFQVMASRSSGAATLGIGGLILIPVDEWSCAVDDPVSDATTGNSALRGSTVLDVDGGVLKIRTAKLQSAILAENWTRDGRPPTLEPALLTRIYALQMYYPTTWGTGPMLLAHGGHLVASVYAHNRYSALRGAG